MTSHIFADSTFDPPPTRDQHRLALTSMSGLRDVNTAPAMDIGPDLDDPLGRVRYEAYLALNDGREFVRTRDVIAWAHEQFPDVA